MNAEFYKEQVMENVIGPMLSYMEEWDEDECEYTEEEVEACKELICTYLDALNAMEEPADEDIMEQVKILVLALNELNEKTDYVLIETDAREAIWEIIQESAVACGLQEYGDDITEEWREW